MEKITFKSRWHNFLNGLWLSNKAFLMVIILFFILTFFSDVFLTSRNLLNVSRQICVNTIVALGFTFIIGAGEIDLSVGSAAGFIGVIMALLMRDYNVPVPLAIFCGLLIGLGSGALNALVISAFKLPPFVVTLATQSLYRGLIYIFTKMTPITRLPESFIFLGQGYILGIPVPVYLMVIIYWQIKQFLEDML